MLEQIINICILPGVGKTLLCYRFQGIKGAWWQTGEWFHLRLARLMSQVTQGLVLSCKELDVLIL